MTALRWMVPSDRDAPALWMAGQTWSYGQLLAEGARLSPVLDVGFFGAMNLVAILGNHSALAYAAIMAAHRSGRGYLPLNPAMPTRRLADILAQSQTRTLVVPGEGLAALEALLPLVPDALTLICPDDGGFGALPHRFPQHHYITREACSGTEEAIPVRVPTGSSLAYVMFTSGSTGRPKGVAVTFDNLTAYVDHVQAQHATGPGDRVAQPADLTFDLCIHPIFATWASGACLCPIPALSRMAPAKFILDARLTVWVSVPSVAMFLEKVQVLRPGVFPSIRLSFFCGEPLPVRTAEAWHRATPNARLVNLYGPTEATVAISEYVWQGAKSVAEARHGIVPMGWIFPTQQAALLASEGVLITGFGEGELCLSGSQVTTGYLNNPEKTAHHYIHIPETGERLWYRTGDWVQRREDGCLFFLRRVDNQIKLRGHRIELQEIDAVIRAVCGNDFAVTIPWPRNEEGVQGLVACMVASDSVEGETVLEACRRHLPSYMVPSRVERLPTLPLNANGKIDRVALIHHLDAQANRKKTL